MKVAISTDTLLKRDHATEVYDLLCELFPEAEAYTLAHKPGAILGPAEQRKIHSTFLSNKVNSIPEVGKYFFSIPSALKNLFIPCSTDVILNISRGLSHGIKKCKETYQITYLYDEFWFDKKRDSVMELLFGSMVKKFSFESLKQIDELWVASEVTFNELKDRHPNIHLVEPFFNIHEFPIIPSSTFQYDYFLIDTNGLDESLASEIIKVLERKNKKYKFVGVDGHLSVLSDKNSFGDRCAGELAPLLSGCHSLITFNQSSFPLSALQAKSTGREVLSLNNKINRNYLSDVGVTYFENLNDLEDLIDRSPKTEADYKKELHHSIKKYNGVKFKHLIDKAVKKVSSKDQEASDNCC